MQKLQEIIKLNIREAEIAYSVGAVIQLFTTALPISAHE